MSPGVVPVAIAWPDILALPYYARNIEFSLVLFAFDEQQQKHSNFHLMAHQASIATTPAFVVCWQFGWPDQPGRSGLVGRLTSDLLKTKLTKTSLTATKRRHSLSVIYYNVMFSFIVCLTLLEFRFLHGWVF